MGLVVINFASMAESDNKRTPAGTDDKRIPAGTYEASSRVEQVLAPDGRVFQEASQSLHVVTVNATGEVRTATHTTTKGVDCWGFGVGVPSVDKPLSPKRKGTRWLLISRDMNTTEATPTLTPCGGGISGYIEVIGTDLEVRDGRDRPLLKLKRVARPSETAPSGFFCATATDAISVCARTKSACELSRDSILKGASWSACEPAVAVHCSGWDSRATIYRCSLTSESCETQRRASTGGEVADRCTAWN